MSGFLIRPGAVLAATWLAVITLTAAGCRPQTSPPATPATAPAGAHESPEKLAAAVFDLLRQERAAIAGGDPAAAAAAHAALLQLADVDAIRTRFASQPAFRPLVGDDPPVEVVKLWGATAGYYLDGVDLPRAVAAGGADFERGPVTLLVPAACGSEATRFRLQMNRRGERWLIERLDFDAPRGGSPGPSSAPSSVPAAGASTP